MLLYCVVVLFVSTRGLSCDEGITETKTVSGAAEEVTASITEVPSPPEIKTVAGPPLEEPTGVPLQLQPEGVSASTVRTPRRRGRRPRGYYNDFRYRNRANNPYNPNSPYSFRGRPAAPVGTGGYYDPRYRTGYENQGYYDPYNQGYYTYPGYDPSYYGYPYQPQPQPVPPQPVPQTVPPTEKIPDLYYVQKSSNPDGQYEYKKVSVYQENYGARRPRATRWPQQPQPGYGQAPQAPQGYYGYPYDPYNRRPPPPPQPYYNQPYYNYPPQQQQQQPQWGQGQYVYPKIPGGPRSRLRTGKPVLRPTALFSPWSLTTSPTALFDGTKPSPIGESNAAVPAEQITEASGD